MSNSPRWKIVWFKDGKRQEPKQVWDPKKAKPIVDKMNKLPNIKAHLVCKRFPKFPPRGVPDEVGQYFCPYCRRWRWFAVPKKRPQVYVELDIMVCKWCGISERDWFVQRYNTELADRNRVRRRRKGRKKRKGDLSRV